ncbi:VOC family protein [Massilia sp. CF038]|uniref:VOC family protein n=1 Tax=Massilia sp. CF038 TaxID=1881045 RepID=UPI0009105EEE|nr:VOC family protein [Massilia sp. CF038]SHH43409.1 Catechol 2,3-dioxygenase [Massilia sp. CF038]
MATNLARITGVDHVQLAMPVGAEAQARAFYSGVLGLPEIPKPAVLAVRGGAWFQCGTLQLHLGADSNFQAAKKAHPALVVSDFAAFAAMLAGHGVALTPEETVGGRLRGNLFDPFGNRIELIAA